MGQHLANRHAIVTPRRKRRQRLYILPNGKETLMSSFKVRAEKEVKQPRK